MKRVDVSRKCDVFVFCHTVNELFMLSIVIKIHFHFLAGYLKNYFN